MLAMARICTACSTNEVIPLFYKRDRGRPAARLDQTHEAHHPHAGLAFQRGPHGHGLHAEVLRAGRGRHVEQHEAATNERKCCQINMAKKPGDPMRLGAYQTDGFYDEMFDEKGSARPEAQLLLETLESLEDGQLQRCSACG